MRPELFPHHGGASPFSSIGSDRCSCRHIRQHRELRCTAETAIGAGHAAPWVAIAFHSRLIHRKDLVPVAATGSPGKSTAAKAGSSEVRLGADAVRATRNRIFLKQPCP